MSANSQERLFMANGRICNSIWEHKKSTDSEGSNISVASVGLACLYIILKNKLLG